MEWRFIPSVCVHCLFLHLLFTHLFVYRCWTWRKLNGLELCDTRWNDGKIVTGFTTQSSIERRTIVVHNPSYHRSCSLLVAYKCLLCCLLSSVTMIPLVWLFSFWKMKGKKPRLWWGSVWYVTKRHCFDNQSVMRWSCVGCGVDLMLSLNGLGKEF